MAVCPKCNATNEEGVTRCKACNAILPVKMGSKSTARWERVRRQPDLVGMKCPHCGTSNPYTRLRCRSCSKPLSTSKAKAGPGKVWAFAGIGVVILVIILLAAFRGS